MRKYKEETLSSPPFPPPKTTEAKKIYYVGPTLLSCRMTYSAGDVNGRHGFGSGNMWFQKYLMDSQRAKKNDGYIIGEPNFFTCDAEMLWDLPFHFASTFLTFGNEEATEFDFHDLQQATNASPDTGFHE